MVKSKHLSKERLVDVCSVFGIDAVFHLVAETACSRRFSHFLEVYLMFCSCLVSGGSFIVVNLALPRINSVRRTLLSFFNFRNMKNPNVFLGAFLKGK